MCIEKLQMAMRQNLLVSVYTNKKTPNSCSVGFVHCINNDILVLRGVSRDGLDDGLIIRKLKSIFKVEMNGEYEAKIKFLYFVSKNRIVAYPLLPDMKSVLSYSMKSKYVVSIWLKNKRDKSYKSGYIIKIKDTKIVFDELDDYGRYIDKFEIAFDSIKSVDVNGINERQISLFNGELNNPLSNYARALEKAGEQPIENRKPKGTADREQPIGSGTADREQPIGSGLAFCGQPTK